MKDALTLAGLQFLNWGLCTISWRSVSQANITASIITDTTLGTLQFFVIRKIAKTDADSIPQFLGYTIGGVAGTVAGIYLTIWLLGK